MVKIFIIFIIGIFALTILITVAVFRRNANRGRDGEKNLYDDQGNHLYYDRSLIRKSAYARKNPRNWRDLRTFRRLFSPKDKTDTEE